MNRHLVLHLTLLENIGPAIIQKIQALQRSGTSVSDLYLFSPADWQQTCGFTDATAQKLAEGLADKKILDTELDLIEQHNIQWATVEDEIYPHLLREIYLPPAVLYCMGALLSDSSVRFESSRARPDASTGSAVNTAFSSLCARPDASTGSAVNTAFSSLCARPELVEGFPRAQKIISIVGARKADNYGERVVDAIVPELVAAGYTIVSGGALGIDTMAHTATLKSSGKTIAVLGSGLLVPYPSSNRNLFKSIVEHGGSIVSTFPLTMEALPGHFPARNRIITGLSRGCLVVQAAKKSGALISAHYALEQGREVFAVPGLVGDELSAGCNALIQSGAKLVMNAADILEEFGDRVIIPARPVRPAVPDEALCEVWELVEGIEPKQLSLESALTDSSAHNPSIHFPSHDATENTQGERITKSSHCSKNFSPARPECPVGVYRRVVDNYIHCSPQQKLIIFACKQPSYFDGIVNATQLTSETVQSELFNLQLDGIVSQDFTGMWVVLQ